MNQEMMPYRQVDLPEEDVPQEEIVPVTSEDDEKVPVNPVVISEVIRQIEDEEREDDSEKGGYQDVFDEVVRRKKEEENNRK